MPEKPRDIHHAIVLGAIERDDEEAATAEAAQSADVPVVSTSERAVRGVVEQALRVSLSRLDAQRGMVRKQVDREAAMLAKEDPTTVKAVTNGDIAEERARRVKG